MVKRVGQVPELPASDTKGQALEDAEKGDAASAVACKAHDVGKGHGSNIDFNRLSEMMSTHGSGVEDTAFMAQHPDTPQSVEALGRIEGTVKQFQPCTAMTDRSAGSEQRWKHLMGISVSQHAQDGYHIGFMSCLPDMPSDGKWIQRIVTQQLFDMLESPMGALCSEAERQRPRAAADADSPEASRAQSVHEVRRELARLELDLLGAQKASCAAEVEAQAAAELAQSQRAGGSKQKTHDDSMKPSKQESSGDAVVSDAHDIGEFEGASDQPRTFYWQGHGGTGDHARVESADDARDVDGISSHLGFDAIDHWEHCGGASCRA
ncbi:unnamed protein product [Prorocentrum cordatum]|uniref:Uncharacterized protein n=1 Tax=Prorocentrum cordatum TaxID=2364126 RepID=A0ABN9VSP2_9DINO|nr:unnamed protein product [Polarella glacialis]